MKVMKCRQKRWKYFNSCLEIIEVCRQHIFLTKKIKHISSKMTYFGLSFRRRHFYPKITLVSDLLPLFWGRLEFHEKSFDIPDFIICICPCFSDVKYLVSWLKVRKYVLFTSFTNGKFQHFWQCYFHLFWWKPNRSVAWWFWNFQFCTFCPWYGPSKSMF